MVAGPQLGYFYPEFFMEIDMEGGGVSVRGGSLAGIPNVLIGRGPDYGWSVHVLAARTTSTRSPRRSAAATTRTTPTRASAAR